MEICARTSQMPVAPTLVTMAEIALLLALSLTTVHVQTVRVWTFWISIALRFRGTLQCKIDFFS